MFHERVPADAQRRSHLARQGNLDRTIVWGKIAACVAFIAFMLPSSQRRFQNESSLSSKHLPPAPPPPSLLRLQAVDNNDLA